MSGLRIEGDGPFARVTLDRPEVRNAFDAELIGELRATFDAMTSESPDVLRGVVLAGAGPVFCAGADVEWMRSAIGMGSTRTSGMPPRSTRCSPRSTAVRCR